MEQQLPYFDRITFAPNIMGGQACIRGMRIIVSLLVNLVANGMSNAEILDAYPYLEPEDIDQALCSVAWLAEESRSITTLPEVDALPANRHPHRGCQG
jgi:uncharacterized protein (DUF433 family)